MEDIIFHPSELDLELFMRGDGKVPAVSFMIVAMSPYLSCLLL